MTTNKDVHLLSGAYALDAVTAEEAAAVEAEMVRSEDLRGEIAELTDTAVMLGLAVRAETPPPALRARLLDAIGDLPQLPAEPRAEQDEPVVLAAMPAGAHVVPARRRSRMARRPAILLSLAAVAVLLFGGGLAVDRLVLQPQSDYSQVFAASDAQVKTASIAGGGNAKVVWSKQLDETAVSLTGIKHSTNTTLQMWRLNSENVAVSAGLYQPSGEGNFVVLKGAMQPGQKFAVTVEPQGGSKQPTSPALVIVNSA